MASVEQRNARLDAVVHATEAWADRRTREFEDRVASAKKILKGRTGSERLAAASSQAAAELVVNEIDDFLLTS